MHELLPVHMLKGRGHVQDDRPNAGRGERLGIDYGLKVNAAVIVHEVHGVREESVSDRDDMRMADRFGNDRFFQGMHRAGAALGLEPFGNQCFRRVAGPVHDEDFAIAAPMADRIAHAVLGGGLLQGRRSLCTDEFRHLKADLQVRKTPLLKKTYDKT
jgi:hypothetical protein